MTWLVVMGVSGCGKSHVGAAIATALGLPLVASGVGDSSLFLEMAEAHVTPPE